MGTEFGALPLCWNFPCSGQSHPSSEQVSWILFIKGDCQHDVIQLSWKMQLQGNRPCADNWQEAGLQGICLSVYKGFWHNAGYVLTCCRLMWQSWGWYFVQSHRCTVNVLSNSNWILFRLGMEHLIFSLSSHVCKMLSSFSTIPYSPNGCCAFQNKPSRELNRGLGGSSQVVVCVAA